MKKIIPIIIVILLIGSGAYYFINKSQKTGDKANRPEGIGGLTVLEDNSLMGWLKRGKSIECVLSTAEGSMSIKTKNDNVRIDGIPYAFSGEATNQQSGTSLTADGWTYFWSGTEGVKFNIAEMEEASGDEVAQFENNEDVKWEDWVNDMEEEEVSYDCSEKSFPNDIFIPPNNVNFIDFSEFTAQAEQYSKEYEESMQDGELPSQEDFMKQLEDLKAKMPSSGNLPPIE